MAFCTQLSETIFSFWLSCIAAENLDTGKIGDHKFANTITIRDQQMANIINLI